MSSFTQLLYEYHGKNIISKPSFKITLGSKSPRRYVCSLRIGYENYSGSGKSKIEAKHDASQKAIEYLQLQKRPTIKVTRLQVYLDSDKIKGSTLKNIISLIDAQFKCMFYLTKSPLNIDDQLSNTCYVLDKTAMYSLLYSSASAGNKIIVITPNRIHIGSDNIKKFLPGKQVFESIKQYINHLP